MVRFKLNKIMYTLEADDRHFLQIAIEEAMKGIQNGEGGPFGAVIVKNADDIRSRLRQEFDQALKTAKKVDSQQGTPERMEIWGLDNDAVSPGFSLFDGEIE